MKKITASIFLLSICLTLLVMQVKAQVTIGSALEPNEGAILDLKEEGITTRGLGMPRVELKELNSLTMGDNIIANEGMVWEQHAGLLVYNINKCLGKGGDGLYVWNGSLWQRLPERDKYIDALYQPNSYWVAPGTTKIEIPVEKAFRIWEYYGSEQGKNRLPTEFVTGTLTPILHWQDALIIPSSSSLSISGSSRSDIITVTLAGGTVEGNAVIALKDGSGTIRWSWHIWVTDDPTTANLNGGRFTWMDRHLGATSAIAGEVGTIGLTYQWGRKDPFPMAQAWNTTEPILQSGHGELATAVDKTTLTNANTSQINFKNSITSPLSFIKKSTSSSDWYNPSTSPDESWNERWDRTEEGCFYKSPFDPCPEGWRIPAHQYDETGKTISTTNPWKDLINKTAVENAVGDKARNWDNFGTYPYSGYRSLSGGITSTATYAYTWSASVEIPTASATEFKAYTFYYGKTFVQQSQLSKAFSFSVRCVKE